MTKHIDPAIIDFIISIRKEREKEIENVLQIPVYEYNDPPKEDKEEEIKRGVIVIDLDSGTEI